MSSQESKARFARLRSENIGGIDETTVDLDTGVNVLVGRNATNRTSFLQSIMAALGSENVSLKGDADEGFVDLEIGDQLYTRTLTRTADGIVTTDDPYLDDPELADLFAFLLESNEARRTVAQSGDLHELIMRPIDTEALRGEIDELQTERREVDEELEELEKLKRDLPGLEEKRTRLERELDEKRERLAEKEDDIESLDADVDETREEKRELDEKLEELRTVRSDLENVRFDVETQRKSIEALREEETDLEAELEALSDVPAEPLEDVEDEIDRLRDRMQEIDSVVTELQTIVQFNEEMLEGTSSEVAQAFRTGEDDRTETASDLTDKLLNEDESVVCWTCGTNVEKAEIESTLDRLKQARTEKFEERSELEVDLEELKNERRRHAENRDQRTRIEDRLTELETELEERNTTLEDREVEREELNGAIDALEAEVESLEAAEYSEILDLHKEANQLEFELGRVQDQLTETEDAMDEIEQRLNEREVLETRRREIREALEERRTRIERIETTAVEEFNEQMSTVLDLLEYRNIDRIWIERTEREVREGRRKVTKSVFDLHVVRSTDGGTTYEDTIDHLSESEREVTGLVFALAGYLVHEVYERCPFMLLDSLEAIDSNRIATLVGHFEEYAEFLVVALLPEDATALDDTYQRITDI